MRRILCVVLLLCSGGFTALAAQERPPPVAGKDPDFRLERNYPNPFSSETRIPFVLEEPLFEEGKTVTVSLRIYNILQQFVAAPVALRYPGGDGLPLLQLEYRNKGRYEAYWDGRDREGKPVLSGVYFVQMWIEGRGRALPLRMFVSR
ncbi:MAG: hypothetical protein F4139_01340 [Gemmatimonadetes bacterium]|nr:hypothetical protein [Gemmatimonadota bacterium]MYA64479.1 hypothetical protein [Gemmatimonadota bacterium]MYB99782.1 hypothetical protein [Gemmatimonadota bacterium]MYH51574.1 hypothetical protein [Gemmatimonadota bacterium]MYI45627.1 hypothetical protein [Gemmatimonadota bacterium]